MNLVEIWSFRANSTVRLGKPKAGFQNFVKSSLSHWVMRMTQYGLGDDENVPTGENKRMIPKGATASKL